MEYKPYPTRKTIGSRLARKQERSRIWLYNVKLKRKAKKAERKIRQESESERGE